MCQSGYRHLAQVRSGLLMTLATCLRINAESLFETRFEKGDAPIAAFQSDVFDGGVAVVQELAGPDQAQFGLPNASGLTKMLVKQPVQMSDATATKRRKLLRGVPNKFNIRHLHDNVAKAVAGQEYWRRRLISRHGLAEERGHQTQDIGALHHLTNFPAPLEQTCKGLGKSVG